MPQIEADRPPNGQNRQGQVEIDRTPDGANPDDGGDADIALRLMEEKQVVVFCDELQSPIIALPDDPVKSCWPLHHQRVRSWIAELFYMSKSRFVGEKDISAVLRVLEGRAWKAPRQIPTVDPTWHEIERNPVALALVAYANAHGDFAGPTRDLFGKLLASDIQDRLRMASLPQKFPTNTQVFSRRITTNVKVVLSIIGLDVAVEHKDTGSYCTLKIRNGVFVREPDGFSVRRSAKPSVTSQGLGGTSPPADATDATKTLIGDDLQTALTKIGQIREEQT